MANQIGVNFIPSEENQAMGPQRMGQEGGGADMAQAWKVLQLNLPRVLGARALASRKLLESPGSAGVGSQVSPHAAAFQSLIQAMLSGQGGAPSYMPEPAAMPGGNPYMDFFKGEMRAGAPMQSSSVPAPAIKVEEQRAPNVFTMPTPIRREFPRDDTGMFYEDRSLAGTYGSEG